MNADAETIIIRYGPVPYDHCVSIRISRLLTLGYHPFCIVSLNFNVKMLLGAFNQEKAQVGAFSVIVQLRLLIVCSTTDE